VCTTEIGRMALKYPELASKGVKVGAFAGLQDAPPFTVQPLRQAHPRILHVQVAALSCDALKEHNTWMSDVVAHCSNKASTAAERHVLSECGSIATVVVAPPVHLSGGSRESDVPILIASIRPPSPSKVGVAAAVSTPDNFALYVLAAGPHAGYHRLPDHRRREQGDCHRLRHDRPRAHRQGARLPETQPAGQQILHHIVLVFPTLPNTGLAHPQAGLPLTCRAVFIVGPDKKLKLSLNYPASVGRNMDEVVRVIDALQLSAEKVGGLVQRPWTWRAVSPGCPGFRLWWLHKHGSSG
jgi:hypothetical protein